MIKVTMVQEQKGIYSGFCLEGHAGYADSGQDIICSAVSILAINTINSIEAFTADTIKVDADEKKGFLKLLVASPVSKESNLLLSSMALGLKGVLEEYGSQYIEMIE